MYLLQMASCTGPFFSSYNVIPGKVQGDALASAQAQLERRFRA